ncbi:hypothetical protein predicted by Glimmer/Critica [Acetobacter ghanensis]|uniref:Uncharacterized protein n=1 Tax=Acetobacter ghanensis TaxID=431306 RepID=A0A0U5F258_9PROT|nr:hypothetical protein predicted by Glimmer/Critica [Acetobacter ghanensis]
MDLTECQKIFIFLFVPQGLHGKPQPKQHVCPASCTPSHTDERIVKPDTTRQNRHTR